MSGAIARLEGRSGVAPVGIPHVLYYRVRPSEPKASATALAAQYATRDLLIAGGKRIAAIFTEHEGLIAQGGEELRPALRLAYAVAQDAGARSGLCTLVIMRVDPIGAGDPFPVHKPPVAFLDKPEAGVMLWLLGWAGMERQLRHEWAHATSSERDHR